MTESIEQTAPEASTPALRAQILGRLTTLGARTLPELSRAVARSRTDVRAELLALTRLGRIVRCPQGAHVYWRAAPSSGAPAVADAVPVDAVRQRWHRPALQPLRHARRCYGHLAGELGVAQWEALVGRGLLVAENGHWQLSGAGRSWLAGLDVVPPRGRGAWGKSCLDWSERRDHLGGGLGRILLDAWLARGWLQDGRAPRSLLLTALGQREFLPWLRGQP